MLRSSTTSYYQADGLGSITSLSSGAGALAQTYGYDSFGKQTSSSGSLTNPFQYTARESDTETGLYYYRARYYEPGTGRFTSEDPIRFSAGLNFYTYVRNRSASYVDPSGLLAEVYCERIDSRRGGGFLADAALLLSQAMHCYLRIACGGKDETFEIYGPQPADPKHGEPHINPFNPRRGGRRFNVYPPPGLRCCEFENRLRSAYQRESSRLPIYNGTGPNSNTFVNQIITDAGGYADFPIGAYGVDTGIQP